MVVWKINRIPSMQEEGVYNGNFYQYVRQILFSLPNNMKTNVCVEMVFLHTIGEEIDIYLVLRNTFDSGEVSSIEMQLTSVNYQVSRLDTQSVAVFSQQLTDMACMEMNAVVKTEKIVTTPFMQEGYYYWADVLLNDGIRQPDNFNMLFQALQKCENSFISYQLMPAIMQSYETEVLQYLDMHLEQHIHNHNLNGYVMTMYEPYAQPAHTAYHHYINKRGEPLFQYNIVAGSMSGSSGFLANQIIATIKSQTVNAPEIQAIPVRLSRGDFSLETFSSYLSGLLQQQYRDKFIWGGNIIPPNALFRLPYLVTVDEALMFFRLPYDDGRIVGIKGSSFQSSNELLSEVVTDSENVIFGQSASTKDVYVGAPAKLFAQHALIVGMPGTGKTTFCINLLLQFHKKGIPFLAIEPTKAEYRAMIDAIPNLQVFTPGNSGLCPFIVNPFIPPKGIKIEKYIPSLYSAFKAAFSMPSPLDVTFMKAIRAAYNRYGWRNYSQAGDPGVTPFGFHEFILVFNQIIDESDYSKEVKGNLRSGGVLRLSNLIEQNRNIFDTIHTIPIEDILSKPTVIELNAIDDIEQKALIIAMLLINVAVYTKSSQTEVSDLGNVILLDEAHVLLEQRSSSADGQPSAQSYAAQFVENLIAEIRSYGTSVIIADQRPKAVGEAIVANTDIKIVFRLTEKAQKDIICDSTDMDDSMRQQLSQLEKGQAYIYYHKLTKPQMVITPDIREKEKIRVKVSDEEIKQRNLYWNDKAYLLKPYSLCKHCKDKGGGCNLKLRADAEYYCNFLWDHISKEITDTESLRKRIYGVPILLKGSLAKYNEDDRIILLNCIRISLQRKAAMEKGILLDDAKVEAAILNTEL